MPFIFHSKKQSIFETKPSGQGQIGMLTFKSEASKKQQTGNTFQLCKEHPFRKWNRPKGIIVNAVSCLENSQNDITKNTQKPIHRLSHKIQKVEPIEKEKKIKKHSLDQEDYDQKMFPNLGPDMPRIHRQKINGPDNKKQKQQVLKEIHKSSSDKGRLKYEIDRNPGPGSYDIDCDKKPKTTVLYSNQTVVRSLPQPIRNSLESLLLSIQKKFPQRETKRFISDCHYKNQNSPNFKSSILKKDNSLKTNGALLNMLFCKKKQEDKENQSETTCESRMAHTISNEIFDDGYEKNEETSPGPFSYNPNFDFSQPKHDNNAKPFLSGSPKNLSYLQTSLVPGPGTYKEVQIQKGDVFRQNQNKKPNKFDCYEEPCSNVCAFSTAVPRELHFDTEKLCQQEFYYSPKNNLSEKIESKILQGSRSNKHQFGSSLERFSKDQMVEDDPFKYCFSKIKTAAIPTNCPSLTFKEKRELFSSVENLIAPNRYHDNTNTIYKSTEKQLFKKLLQSKYQDEVILLKEKKNNMEKVLLQESRKSVDIKTSKKKFENLNPDKYKEFLWKIKTMEKENISFGYNKDSVLKSSIEPRKQLDIYYDTEPSWEKKSFNKGYGYEIAEY